MREVSDSDETMGNFAKFRTSGFEIVDFRKFDAPVTLTLTLDDLEYYIVRSVSSISIDSTIEHVAPLSFTVNGRTDDGHLNWFY